MGEDVGFDIGLREKVAWRAKEHLPRQLRRKLAQAARLKAPLYRGDDVECAICAQRWSRFPGGLCPGCGSAGRHRLIVLFLRAEGLLKPGSTVIHFAPEPGLQRCLGDAFGPGYIPADLVPAGGTQRIDATDIPLGAGTVDGIITSHVLEHIPDDRRAMAEMRRVLKPGGWALVMVPISAYRTIEDPSVTTPGGRLKRFGQHDHVRVYGYDIEERLREAGFTVDSLRYAERLNRRFYGLSKDDLVHFCR